MEKKKIRKIRYRLSVVFFGVVLIFGLMFYRYMKTVTLEDVLSQDRKVNFFLPKSSVSADDVPDGGDASEQNPEQPQPAEAGEIVNPIPESEPVGEEYFDDCVFIGDSVAYGLGSYGVVPSSRVLASVSMNLSKADTEKIDTSFGSVTVLEALAELNPKNIYTLMGSNSAAYMSSDEMYQSYSAFLNKIRIACPDARVYIISTTPVTSGKEASVESPVKNADIDALNSKLLDYADTNGVCYIDINSAFKDEAGCLKADYAENDGMHLKYSAYTDFVSYILSHTVKEAG